MTAAIFESVIAYLAALGLFVVLWTIGGWCLGVFRAIFNTNGRWVIGKDKRRG